MLSKESSLDGVGSERLGQREKRESSPVEFVRLRPRLQAVQERFRLPRRREQDTLPALRGSLYDKKTELNSRLQHPGRMVRSFLQKGPDALLVVGHGDVPEDFAGVLVAQGADEILFADVDTEHNIVPFPHTLAEHGQSSTTALLWDSSSA